MSTAMTFKCPCCGGYLEFDPSLQKFKCLYCGQVLSEVDLRDQSRQREQAAEATQAEQPREPQADNDLRTYHCTQCGAEVVTDATTAATRCYFCHSPIVLHDRLDDEFRPNGVIPFKLDKETAMQQFRAYIKKKKFVDHAFFSEDQLEMFSGVYYPYWYMDVSGAASFDGEGTRTSVSTTPKHIVTRTSYFQVERRANMAFRSIARKALNKVDGKLSDGIHPYDEQDIVPYASGYLSGFLAEKRDISEKEIRQGVISECEAYAEDMIRQDHTFNSLRGNAVFKAQEVKSRYVLLPAWVLTWKGGPDGVPYYYLMNGQTGQVCGKLPINKRKLWTRALGIGAAVFAAVCAGGMFVW